jgi:hypothetical protein
MHPLSPTEYPYLFIEKDGSARELHPDERTYLDAVYHPGDGGRPYIKFRYPQLNGWGEIDGYLKRSNLPLSIAIRPAPEANPNRPRTRQEDIQFLRDKGCEVTENADGSYTAIPVGVRARGLSIKPSSE